MFTRHIEDTCFLRRYKRKLVSAPPDFARPRGRSPSDLGQQSHTMQHLDATAAMQVCLKDGDMWLQPSELSEGRVLAELHGMADDTATLPFLCSEMMIWRNRNVAGMSESSILAGLKVRAKPVADAVEACQPNSQVHVPSARAVPRCKGAARCESYQQLMHVAFHFAPSGRVGCKSWTARCDCRWPTLFRRMCPFGPEHSACQRDAMLQP